MSQKTKLNEDEGKYLKSQRKYWAKMKRKLVGKGNNRHTGGGKGHTRPSFNKGKGSPAGFGMLEEEEEQLNEKMMLKPGPKGWDLYYKLVAEAYLAAPKFESRAVPHFEAMIPFVNKMFKRIEAKINVHFVDYHAYNNVEELRADVFNNGIMKIATVDAEHDIFDPQTNAKFRAVHDFMSHIQAIGSRGTDFSLKGEIQSYNTHLKTMPPSAWPALFTEIVGQASTYFYQDGEFGEQKICLLDGFDYENLGVVEGYDIVDKELVKMLNNQPITENLKPKRRKLIAKVRKSTYKGKK
jgi:hypothetical protein